MAIKDYVGEIKTEKQTKEIIKKKEYQNIKKQTLKNLKIVIEKIEKDEFIGAIFLNQMVKGREQIIGFGTVLGGNKMLVKRLVERIFEDYREILEDFVNDIVSSANDVAKLFTKKDDDEYRDVGVG